MSDIMRNSRKQFIWGSIILGFVIGAAGCTKGGATVNNPAVCYISIMNQAPYGVGADIYFNGTQVTANGGILPGQFSSQYGSVKPGTYTVDFKKAGTDSLLVELPAVAYDTSTFYTLVLYNTAPGSSAMQAARITDDFSQVSQMGALNAYYRFLNLSPDEPNVNLYLSGTLEQPNREPKDFVSTILYDQFQAISPQVYNIQVKDANSDSVVATLASTPLAAGSAYTIFLGGKISTGFTISVLPALF